jgi:hypothetical protein
MAAVSATPVLASATAVQTTASYTATTVTFKVPYSGATPAWVRVFIDTDRVATSGFKTNSIGANFMVENGNLYRYTGSNGGWGWTFVKLVNNTSANSLATVIVNRADIGASATTAYPNPNANPDADADANADADADANANANADANAHAERRRRRQRQRQRQPYANASTGRRSYRSITTPAPRPSPTRSAASIVTSVARPR